MDSQNIFSGLSLSTPSWDLLILVVFLVGIFVYIFKLGRDRAFIMLLSTYLALALVGKIDIIMRGLRLNFDLNFNNQTVAFLLGVFLVFWIISKSSLTSVFNQGPSGSWFHTLVIGFLQIGLTFSIIVAFLSKEEAGNMSLFIKSFFIDDTAKFFWLVTPFVVTILVKGK